MIECRAGTTKDDTHIFEDPLFINSYIIMGSIRNHKIHKTLYIQYIQSYYKLSRMQ